MYRQDNQVSNTINKDYFGEVTIVCSDISSSMLTT